MVFKLLMDTSKNTMESHVQKNMVPVLLTQKHGIIIMIHVFVNALQEYNGKVRLFKESIIAFCVVTKSVCRWDFKEHVQ